VTVVEVDRPDRRTRRTKGKSDPIDAIAAARATLAGTAMGTPKTRTGPVEAIRALRVARQGAVKARTAAINQIRGLVTAAPEALRAQLTKLSAAVLIKRCAILAYDPAMLHDPEHTTAAALAGLARRAIVLTEEITTLDRQITPLVHRVAPRTSALFGVGPDVAAQLLTTAGDNPNRLHSEAALAHLCGAAPIPASSGRVRRHRLHRGGDRGANHALHTIALCRLRYDPRTRAYMHRRTPKASASRRSSAASSATSSATSTPP
ncbi:MAG TPA: transposase, partial [Micromonosporaceae bacterium]|nr:transposase [Micromonosporaceae bacterium]